MKILLLGNHGQLGWELQRSLMGLGPVSAIDFPQLDLADEARTVQMIRQAAPQLIVNATAYTAVDKAESEADLAHAINARGPGLLAEVARTQGAALIHVSTDYVFDGTKGSPYVETDAPHPLGVYGQSKLAGEGAVQQVGGAFLILRTAWVYSLRRDSFVTKVLQWARQQTTMKVVTDQVSNPTWARALAEAIAHVVATGGEQIVPWLAERSGLYHLAGDGYTSRMAWVQEILRLDPRLHEQVVKDVLPAYTVDFPTPAARPLFSALDCAKFTQIFGLRLPSWQEALGLALAS